jgi:hypothetical protein
VDSTECPSGSEFDGLRSRGDTWALTYLDGEYYWARLAHSTAIGKRAWFGMTVWHRNEDPTTDISTTVEEREAVPRIWVFGGAEVGDSSCTRDNRILEVIKAKADAWWSRDGISWTQVNYFEGGGKTQKSFFSTQEWSKAVVDLKDVYLGIWGLSVCQFKSDVGGSLPRLYLIAGDRDGNGGALSNDIFESRKGLLCDIHGLPCNGL